MECYETQMRTDPMALMSPPTMKTNPPNLLSEAAAPRDLVSIHDLSPAEILALFNLTSMLKQRPADFRGVLAGKQMVMFFEKPSLRTRLTFEAGMDSLGGSTFFVDQTASRLNARESLYDIAHNLERWIDIIVLRTFSHAVVEEMATYANVPVINALSELEHPCQALADFFTLREHFGDLKTIHFAYVGDGNNMAHSLLLAGADLTNQCVKQGNLEGADFDNARAVYEADKGKNIEAFNSGRYDGLKEALAILDEVERAS